MNVAFIHSICTNVSILSHITTNLGSRVVAKHLQRNPRSWPFKIKKKRMSSATTLDQ
jgi:hypothetical protein